ncbi:bifunctional adenosylcobinamide kinase/adenosylcobinamide-phosphate guanylyltransferase [Clostridium sp. P21]|uniref:Adenosylcobinamide kinase n=1 Tax=Clostridium muellerianum TaxID=2716538 RepID=A0A7Y0EGS6_9CLOT|nr:bifunctional adenosylcobinamide kinase/adenosylcobinamide-phosphate guanylyltransferase [Clostridium muellerianum]NMM63206.1 bifunctional adenosylcobinamide kinase/adenosylcobinamide-phosphate guanylyltransferase [Clostridium muellerianum]
MGKVILVTGGSRSGKSTFAEQILEGKDNVLYIATAKATDEEMKKRIEIHRKNRNQKWSTYEGFKGLDKVLKKDTNKYVMLECIGTMITNLIFEKYHDFDNISMEEIAELEKEVKEEVAKVIFAARENDKEMIVVTNEVGCTLVPEYKLGRIFSDIVGHINQFIGSLSDEAYMITCGFSIKLK